MLQSNVSVMARMALKITFNETEHQTAVHRRSKYDEMPQFSYTNNAKKNPSQNIPYFSS